MTPANYRQQAAATSPPILGITAKSLRARGGESNEINRLVKSKRIRYTLQQHAGRLLFEPDSGKRQKFRVCHCGRSIKGEGVGVHVGENSGRFSGLVTCGSGWTCPVCSGVIGERRREELSAGLVKHTQAGGQCYLLTQTMPHTYTDKLEDGLAMLDKARQTFKNRAAYKALKKTGVIIGTVTGLEVTHGRNGWHPHCHMLTFTSRPLTETEKDELRASWLHALLKAGADSSKKADILAHGLDIRGGEGAADYVAKFGREEKWGLSSELARAASKDAKGEGRKPFALLEDSINGDAHAAALFQEYAHAFHGKRLLTWSPGLKKKFGIEDKPDEALADEVPEQKRVAWLNTEQWRIVLQRDARADLLDFALRYLGEVDDTQAEIDAYIAALEKTPRRSSGWHYQPMERRIH